jgi:hypothetical protein
VTFHVLNRRNRQRRNLWILKIPTGVLEENGFAEALRSKPSCRFLRSSPGLNAILDSPRLKSGACARPAMVMHSTVATIRIQGAVPCESQWLVWALCCCSLKTGEASLALYLKRGACTCSHHGCGNQSMHNRSKEKQRSIVAPKRSVVIVGGVYLTTSPVANLGPT